MHAENICAQIFVTLHKLNFLTQKFANYIKLNIKKINRLSTLNLAKYTLLLALSYYGLSDSSTYNYTRQFYYVLLFCIVSTVSVSLETSFDINLNQLYGSIFKICRIS